MNSRYEAKASVLYHYKIAMPKLHLPRQIWLKYSKHALKAANEDGYGAIVLPAMIDTQASLLVEYEKRDGRPYKLLFRMNYSPECDLLIAIGEGGIVLTVWLNCKSDKHVTLDSSRYQKKVA
jgi:hypothetical protein